ncbi:pre-toxin TG domain-containing protein, partial [Solibacillus ferritrahens]|uniref:pre-toxin TG domain-containing protein n=1 Tax=Solibacillus ferritrahens TaxID=3098620 RepID=UPI00300AA263
LLLFVLTAKAAVKQVKKAAKKAVTQAKKNVKAAVKKTKKALKKVGGKVAVAYTSFKEGGYKDVISAGLDFIPVVGNAKALVEAVIGRDPITGRKLESWERGASVAAILGGPLVKGVKHGGKVLGSVASGAKNIKGKTVHVAESATPTNPTKQQAPKPNQESPSASNIADFNPKTATTKQKGNFGEIKSSDNLLNNKSIKDAGYDLKPIGRGVPSSINDKIVKGIDGLYENTNKESPIKYVIDEAKFGSSQLSKTAKDGPQMSNDWLKGTETGKSRILKAVDGDKRLATGIRKSLEDGKVERVLSKVDSNGHVKTFRIDAKGDIIGEWP